MDNPTVPNADVTSNSNCIKVQSGSRIHSKNVPMHTTNAESSVTIKALLMTSVGIFRLKAVQGLFVATLFIACINAKNVVIFIPPPVEPGEV